MKSSFLVIFLTFFLSVADPSSSEGTVKERPVVTYGSTIKLMNIHSKHRLHSHDIPYGFLRILSFFH